jgi:hypothetical protein
MIEIKDMREFHGAIGNLYVRAGLSPPIYLEERTSSWSLDGIPPGLCLEVIGAYLSRHAASIYSRSGNSTLPIVDRIIREKWRDLHRRQLVRYPVADQQGDRMRQVIPAFDGSSSDEAAPRWPRVEQPREPILSALDNAIQFLRRVLAAGELSTRELHRRARVEGIAPRTLDRARKELGVLARRTGFGRTGQHWVSLPKPRNKVEVDC